MVTLRLSCLINWVFLADCFLSVYADIVATVQRIPKDFEFKSFVHRNGNVLIDPSGESSEKPRRWTPG